MERAGELCHMGHLGGISAGDSRKKNKREDSTDRSVLSVKIGLGRKQKEQEHRQL